MKNENVRIMLLVFEESGWSAAGNETQRRLFIFLAFKFFLTLFIAYLL